MTIEMIYPEYIRLDGGTQPRAKIDEAVWREYGERMKAGDKFPPITVFFDGQDYWLVDGFHRHQASFMYLPGQAMECEVHQGRLEDAQWYSYTVNCGHGVRRTNADKERAVRAALAHPKSESLSNRQIAEHCGVGETMVRQHRKKATTALGAQSSGRNSETGEDSPSDIAAKNGIPPWKLPAQSDPPRLRTGRDGRTINTANIGGKARKKGKAGRGTASTPFVTNRGLSEPLEMIAVQFSPKNHRTAAATLIELFPRSFLEGLVQDLTQHLQKQGQ